MAESEYETATFGTGCFWCTEALFKELKGVIKISPGYSGGNKENPTYKEVCSGTTLHAEVIHILFNPLEITYDELLVAFWHSHDPTQLNQQGVDIGTQYRSVIFYHSILQKEKAENQKNKINEMKIYKKDVVTEIAPFTIFYPASDDHKNYFDQNSEAIYCKFVIKPKLTIFKEIMKLCQ